MRTGFFIASRQARGQPRPRRGEKEGIQMRITQTTSMKQVDRMAFLFAVAQVALALGLFWAFKAHLV
jgi:hypothetical protein